MFRLFQILEDALNLAESKGISRNRIMLDVGLDPAQYRKYFRENKLLSDTMLERLSNSPFIPYTYEELRLFKAEDEYPEVKTALLLPSFRGYHRFLQRRIFERMRELGLTIHALAEVLNVPIEDALDYLALRARHFSEDESKEIADFLSMSVEEFNKLVDRQSKLQDLMTNNFIQDYNAGDDSFKLGFIRGIEYIEHLLRLGNVFQQHWMTEQDQEKKRYLLLKELNIIKQKEL